MSLSPRRGIVSQASMIVGGQIISGLVAFVTTPVIALGLGAEQFGLYALLFLFLGYGATLDFGLTFSLVKHIAEHDREHERHEIDALVNSAAAAYAVMAIAFTLVLVVGRRWIVATLLRVPGHLLPVAEDAMLLLGCSVPFGTAMTISNAVFSGLLRFDYVAFFYVVSASVFAVGAAILVRFGATLTGVMAFYLGVAATAAVVQWVVLLRVLPGFRLVPRARQRKLQLLFGFGGFMFFNQLGRIALLQLDRPLIARLLSVSMAAYYAVPFQISQRLTMLGGAVSTVAFPVSSASLTRGELQAFRHEYLQSARVLAWLTLAPTVVIIVMADKILSYWMSPEFATFGSLPLRLLAFGTWWFSVSSLDAVSIQGSGRPWVTTSFVLIIGALNVVGLVVATPALGLAGAALSLTVSLIVVALLQVWYCSRNVVHWSFGVWGRAIGLPALATALPAVPVILLLRETVSGLSSLILVCVAALAVGYVAGWRVFLLPEERKWVIGRASRLLHGCA